MSFLPRCASLSVILASLTSGCFGESLLIAEDPKPGAETVATPGAPPDAPGDDTDEAPDAGTAGEPPDPQPTYQYACDTSLLPAVSEASVRADFAAEIHPLLVRSEGGCIGCHATSERFRVTESADETFEHLRNKGMFSDGSEGILGRLLHADPALRMPKDQPAWTDDALARVGDFLCKLSAVAAEACATTIDPGPAPLRRLTPEEYDNTVRDLLGDATRPGREFPAESAALGFDNNAHLQRVDALRAEKFSEAAEALAKAAPLATIAPCALMSPVPAACGSTFISTFGEKAFRGPVPAQQATRLLALYDDAKPKYGAARAIRMVLETMLISPRFLYRVETSGTGVAGDLVRLSSWEMASRLSYLFWRTMPDETLFEAARRDELKTPAQIEAQARRLLADPKANAAIVSFHAQWLELNRLDYAEKSETLFADFEALKPMMRTEATRFYRDTFRAGDARKLFTADYSFMNATLAQFYGVTGPTTSTFVKVALPPGERMGVLTQAAFLAGHAHESQTDPVNRGRFVRERLLCQPLSEPPPGVDIEAPSVDPDSTTRERFEQHRAEALCASCHQLMDSIGFGLENFDAVGQYRTHENGIPVDASGEIVATRDADGTFVGPQVLAQRLSESTEVRDCITTQWFRYSFGRAETTQDACSLNRAKDTFAQSDWDMRELLIGLTASDTFQYRRIESGGTP